MINELSISVPKGGWRVSKSSSMPMGVELEVQHPAHRGDCVRALDADIGRLKKGGVWFLKLDYSLDTGVEIISPARDLTWHKTRWEGVLELARQHGMEGEGLKGAGLHVHFEVGKEQAVAGVRFLLANKAKVLSVSGRPGIHTCSWRSLEQIGMLEHLDGGWSSHSVPGGLYKNSCVHFLGLRGQTNIKNGRRIGEFRGFPSTLHPQRFKARLEFVHAVFNEPLATTDWGEWEEGVRRNPKYECLVVLLDEMRGLGWEILEPGEGYKLLSKEGG